MSMPVSRNCSPHLVCSSQTGASEHVLTTRGIHESARVRVCQLLSIPGGTTNVGSPESGTTTMTGWRLERSRRDNVEAGEVARVPRPVRVFAAADRVETVRLHELSELRDAPLVLRDVLWRQGLTLPRPRTIRHTDPSFCFASPASAAMQVADLSI